MKAGCFPARKGFQSFSRRASVRQRSSRARPLIAARGGRRHSYCADARFLARETIVGKRSEDPRSCWKEMIGARARRLLRDRWLGAGLAQSRSTRSHARGPARARPFRKKRTFLLNQCRRCDGKRLPASAGCLRGEKRRKSTRRVHAGQANARTQICKMAGKQYTARPAPMFGLEWRFAALG